jgi:hypothetical protein
VPHPLHMGLGIVKRKALLRKFHKN